MLSGESQEDAGKLHHLFQDVHRGALQHREGGHLPAGEECGGEMWGVVAEMPHQQGGEEDEGLAHRALGHAVLGSRRTGWM